MKLLPGWQSGSTISASSRPGCSISAGTGADLAALAGRYPAAEIIAADSAFAALHRARPARSLLARQSVFRGGGPLLSCADIEKLPFPAAAMTLGGPT